MKKILFTLIFFGFTFAGFSQDTKHASNSQKDMKNGSSYNKKIKKSHKQTAKMKSIAKWQKVKKEHRVGTGSDGTMPNSGNGKVTTNPNGKNGPKNGLVKMKK